MNDSNRALIRTLYDALDRHDGDAMAACYAPDARFRDPAFGELSGAEARDMWRMLTRRAEDLSVELADHDADGDTGTAHWIARYTFTDTGRPVVNDVHARFTFADGLIAEHVDEFSFFASAAGAGADRTGAGLDADPARAHEAPRAGPPARVPGRAMSIAPIRGLHGRHVRKIAFEWSLRKRNGRYPAVVKDHG